MRSDTATVRSAPSGDSPPQAPIDSAPPHAPARVIAMERPVIERMKRGDGRPYRWLVERHQPRIRAIVSRMIGASDEVDDLVQQTFVSAWCALATFDAERPFGAWLNRIAVNLAKDWRKAKRRTEVPLAFDVPSGAGWDPEAAASHREELGAVMDAVARLPALDRELLWGKCVDDLPYFDLSRRLGRPVGALKIRMVRARLRLSADLEARAGNPLGD